MRKILDTTSSCPPYGYLKAPEDKNQWVVDDEAAAVVKRFLQLTMKGNGHYRISIILEEDLVEIPRFYLTKKVQVCTITRSLKTRSDGIAPQFVLSQKTGILRAYDGLQVLQKKIQGQEEPLSPQKRMVFFENTHEAIIDI